MPKAITGHPGSSYGMLCASGCSWYDMRFCGKDRASLCEGGGGGKKVKKVDGSPSSTKGSRAFLGKKKKK